jgi:hypothetical protein
MPGVRFNLNVGYISSPNPTDGWLLARFRKDIFFPCFDSVALARCTRFTENHLSVVQGSFPPLTPFAG